MYMVYAASNLLYTGYITGQEDMVERLGILYDGKLLEENIWIETLPCHHQSQRIIKGRRSVAFCSKIIHCDPT